jgi:hypothetical protein
MANTSFSRNSFGQCGMSLRQVSVCQSEMKESNRASSEYDNLVRVFLALHVVQEVKWETSRGVDAPVTRERKAGWH